MPWQFTAEFQFESATIPRFDDLLAGLHHFDAGLTRHHHYLYGSSSIVPNEEAIPTDGIDKHDPEVQASVSNDNRFELLHC